MGPKLKIEDKKKRDAKFEKLYTNLLEKAEDLTILCDSKIIILVYDDDGTLYEFANETSSVEEIIDRFYHVLETNGHPVPHYWQERKNFKQREIRMLGKDPATMSLEELQESERQLTEELLCIKDRKIQILMEQLEEDRMKTEQLMLENEALRKQIEERRGYLASTSQPALISPAMGTLIPGLNDDPPGTYHAAFGATLVSDLSKEGTKN